MRVGILLEYENTAMTASFHFQKGGGEREAIKLILSLFYLLKCMY